MTERPSLSPDELPKVDLADPRFRQYVEWRDRTAATFFARTRLPLLAAERLVVENTDLDVMDLSEDAF